MSITNHTELKTALANWLHRDDLGSYLDDFIVLAEADINRELSKMQPGLRAMEQEATGTISTATIALPTGYVGTKRFSITIGSRERTLQYTGDADAAEWGSSGLPAYVTTRGDNLVLAPSPDAGYDYSWVYYKKIDALADGTNWIIENAPDLYLYGALRQAKPFIGDDERIPLWDSAYRNVLQGIKEANNADRIAGKMRAKISGAV